MYIIIIEDSNMNQESMDLSSTPSLTPFIYKVLKHF